MRFSHRARQRVAARLAYGIGGLLTASLFGAEAAQAAAVPVRHQAPAQAPAAISSDVSGRVTWDENYIYLRFSR
jgi:hypothetical protein